MPTTVRLVQFNSTLSWTRQRFKGRRRRSTFALRGDEPAPESWSIFPYSVGLLQAHAESVRPGAHRFTPPVFRPDPPARVAERLSGHDVVGFSTYVWNEVRSLETARLLKSRSPSTLVVFGGPQVPDRPGAWMKEHPWVDLCVHGEGEVAFTELLDARAGGRWDEVRSLSWRDGEEIVTNPRRDRLRDLDIIPSPYLSGVFDPLLEASPDEKWIMLWETNRGCPFSCTFCDWGSATASKVVRFGMERLQEEMEWFGALRGELVFCCDANFGILPRDVELARTAAATKARHGHPWTLSVQNTKNRTDRAYEIHRILSEARMQAGVTLSLQSLDEAALAAVKRDNISLESFLELQRRFRADGIPTYTDVILALPGESYDSFADGVGSLITGGQHDRVQFYNCAILPNAPMAAPAYRERWGLETVPQRLLGDHVPLAEEDDGERIEVVVRTGAMPDAAWRRAKVFSWYADLLHFDRLLQVPFVVVHGATGVGYRRLIEWVMDADPERWPLLGEIRHRLDHHAAAIQAGGPEPMAGPDWLELWWPADQWILIDLVTRFVLEDACREAEEAVVAGLAGEGHAVDATLLAEAFRLNRALVQQPFEIDDLELRLSRDVMGVVEATLAGAPLPPPAPVEGTVVRTRPTWLSWDDWLEHVTFCHNQKASYLWPWLARVPAVA